MLSAVELTSLLTGYETWRETTLLNPPDTSIEAYLEHLKNTEPKEEE